MNAILPGSPEKPYTESQKNFLAKQADSFLELACKHEDNGNEDEAKHWRKVSEGLRKSSITGFD